MAKTVNGTKNADKITVNTSSVIVVTGKKKRKFTITKSGKNIISGLAGKDKITVSGGKKNSIYGDAGNDTITVNKKVGTGNKIYGGEGKDTFIINGGKKNSYYGGAGKDTITIKGGNGNYLYGGSGDDKINIAGGKGSIIYGGSLGGQFENDTFIHSSGTATIKDYWKDTLSFKNAVTDVTISGKNITFITGTNGSLTVENCLGNLEQITERGKKKNFYSVSGQSNFYASDDDDIIAINKVNKVSLPKVYGKSGNDTLIGTDEGEYLYGDDGNDVLYGGAGYDNLYGGAGNDILYGGTGGGILDGGAGKDILYGGAGSDDLDGGAGNDILYGYAGKDNLDGGAGTDVLYGGADDDWMYGGAGNDTLYGEAGNDGLYGAEGDDILYGGAGDDFLLDTEGKNNFYGGAGDNTLFANISNNARDTFFFGCDCTGTNEINGFCSGTGTDNDVIKLIEGVTIRSGFITDGSDAVATLSTGGTIRIVGCAGQTINVSK